MNHKNKKSWERQHEPFAGLSRRDFSKLMAFTIGSLGAADPIGVFASEVTRADENCASLGTVPFGVGRYWHPELGSVRALVSVPAGCKIAQIWIPWRRRDANPQDKGIIIKDAQTGQVVRNFVAIEINREYGELVFEVPSSPGDYEVYYLPWTASTAPWNYSISYLPPESRADAGWLARIGLTSELISRGNWKTLPKSEVRQIQARDEFERFDPMEIVATPEERSKLMIAYAQKPFLLFPEERQFPIRMTDDLPLRWIQNGPRTAFDAEARRGEFFVFQVGVLNTASAQQEISVQFGELRSEHGAIIPPSAIRCFNLGGTDWLGRSFEKRFTVSPERVGALWFGIMIARDAAPEDYQSEWIVRSPLGESKLSVGIRVTADLLADAGDGELWRQSRLRWLDSTVGLDDNITAPYIPVSAKDHTISCLDREVRFNDLGLPESILSNGREVLAGPISFVVETANETATWRGKQIEVEKTAPGVAMCRASGSSASFSFRSEARMEFDGHIAFDLRLIADRQTNVKDIRLEVPFKSDVAVYMMGLGRKGGYRPTEWKYVWDINRAINNVWVGDYDAGLQVTLAGAEDTWDLLDLKADGIPKSWGNDGKGGWVVAAAGDSFLVRAYTGERTLEPGTELQFRFKLLITPVKPLDPRHWSQRYYHIAGSPEEAVQCGASIINVHQGNELNPYINYPFLTVDKLSDYVNEAHDLGLKVKIYYTVRELSNHVAEMWALRSLDHEVFKDGPGGGAAWLREHLVSNYERAWHQTLPNGEVDGAIATTGLSRWHNYYLEGLVWLLKNVEIDGLYLDGIGYDREIMKRVRKVLDRNRQGCLIDFHSGNEFTYEDLRVSPANKYMEHFPYVNSLWFGEDFDPNQTSDYWLVEMSGIPFGLFGDMLQDNGNPWRGMLYGMSARYYQGADPKHLWKLWDDFGIQDAEMIGYWARACPVKTSHQHVLATVYKRHDKVLIALASWASEPVNFQLAIDWQELGFDEKNAKLSAPPIEGLQKGSQFSLASPLLVEPGRGWLLILESAPEVPA